MNAMNIVNNIRLAERFDRIGEALRRYDKEYGHLSFSIEKRYELEAEFKMQSLLGTQYQNQYIQTWIDCLIQTIYVRNIKCKMK
ncbi:Uncharacterised protein [Escherichia coli]|uniref:Uncharacterized protein n=3 Tax=root TaxID=1 RepID=A0A5A4U2V1_9CAUD|nr:hypothetical protein [Escherichia coli]QAY00715.1 hypothetical protein Ecwhy1_440 [Escherichia phage Ecwhy_1]WGM49311.1 hypothetical protein EcMJ_069 [Escherichia phage vB_Ec-M-J]BBM61897.1 hypothetical protein EO157G_3080 [Escherichia phage SP27]EHV4444394.1 hypothetical protein [Escherichia coli]VVY12356.1 Uncharacterised protein [Escherichia coli]